jgi:predicted nucleic acid-binding Zn ribbon protein
VKSKFRTVAKTTRAFAQAATVTIDRSTHVVSVRPLRSRRTYDLPLSDVAEMVAQRIIIAEAREKRLAKKRKT